MDTISRISFDFRPVCASDEIAVEVTCYSPLVQQ